MRLLINASTCVVGGGVQVAAGFINHLMKYHPELSRDLAYVISSQVAAECDVGMVHRLMGADRLVLTEKSPGSVISGRQTRSRVREFCKEFVPQRVFTIFGPSYVRFNVPERMGFADAFAYSPTQEAYRWHPCLAKFQAKIKKTFKISFARGAEKYWVESCAARAPLASALGVSEDKVEVIPNCINASVIAAIPPVHINPARPTFLYLAAAYWHKNHMILPQVVAELRKHRPRLEFVILTTLPPLSPQLSALEKELDRLGLSGYVRNVGNLSLQGVANHLSSCTAVMQLSLLETFSATYLEAFMAKVPILVSNRSFARVICKNAALYVDPLNPVDISQAMARIIEHPGLVQDLISRGLDILRDFPTAEEKNEMLLKFCIE